MDTLNASPHPVITAHSLRRVIECERRVWLDAHGDPAARADDSPDVLHLWSLGAQHEQAIHAATAGDVQPVEVGSWADGVALTHDLMDQGAPGIVGAFLEYHTPLDLTDTVYTLRGRVDQLRRVRHHGAYVYAPVEIKQHSQPEAADWVQLDFYVWMLGQLRGAVPPGELWLGADAYGQARRRVIHEYDETRLMDALTRAARVLTAAESPSVVIAPPCKRCPWNATCQETAQEAGQIDLLYGVSRKTRAHMRQAGIATLRDVAALSPEALQQVKGIGPATAPTIRANAQAWLEKRPVRYSPLPEVCTRNGWMFDLETLESGGRAIPWCMGWCDTEGNTHIALVAPVQQPCPLILPDGQAITLTPDSDSAWDVFAGVIGDSGSPIFHWTGYDMGILRATAPDHVRERLEPHMHDLHRSFTRSISLPLNSTSIKPVSAYLGFPWPGYNDWFAAYVDYMSWLETGDLDTLTRACMYQRADVQSMAWVWRWLVQV